MQSPPSPLGTGWYGSFSGRFVAETLIHALDELAEAAARVAPGDAFQTELDALLADLGTDGPLGLPG